MYVRGGRSSKRTNVRLWAKSINGAKREHTARERFGGVYCRRHRQITTLYSVSVIYTCLKTRYRKCVAILNKHALSFVYALCKSTHTLDQRYTTPRVTENDAPYLCVYVCVVCVGGSVSNEGALLSQQDPQARKTESLISIHR